MIGETISVSSLGRFNRSIAVVHYYTHCDLSPSFPASQPFHSSSVWPALESVMTMKRAVSVPFVFLKTLILLQLAFLGGMAISVGKTSPGPSVKTRYGLVQGLIVSMPSPLSPIEVFLGIPYATPPVGINRFSPTRNPQSWPGTRMTDRHGPACPQRFPTNLANETESLKLMSRARRDYLLHIEQSLARNQSEDCLHLNIYAPFQGKLFVPICSRLYIYVCTLASIYLFVLVDESLTNESDE